MFVWWNWSSSNIQNGALKIVLLYTKSFCTSCECEKSMYIYSEKTLNIQIYSVKLFKQYVKRKLNLWYIHSKYVLYLLNDISFRRNKNQGIIIKHHHVIFWYNPLNWTLYPYFSQWLWEMCYVVISCAV